MDKVPADGVVRAQIRNLKDVEVVAISSQAMVKLHAVEKQDVLARPPPIFPVAQNTSQLVIGVPILQEVDVTVVVGGEVGFSASSASFRSSERSFMALPKSLRGPVRDPALDVPPIIWETMSWIVSRMVEMLLADPQNIKQRPGRDIPRPRPKSCVSDRLYQYSELKEDEWKVY